MYEFLDLNLVWFILVAVLLTGYAILDGFDLGVGIWNFFVKDDNERRLMLNSIGPVWDGNEVWLVTGGGALFAAFPHVYATIFSGFYVALMLLLFVIIFRAVAIEFRSKTESAKWRNSWDTAFSVSSLLIALLMGVALGNVIVGLPVQADKELDVSLLYLLNPYSILVGLLTISTFMLHGGIYAALKNENALYTNLKKWTGKAYWIFVALYAVTTLCTFIFMPHMLTNMNNAPALYYVAGINLAAIIAIPMFMKKNKEFKAFVASSLVIATFFALFAIGIFPNIVPAHIPEFSLNMYNAASSQKTLGVMFTIALIGMPLVIAYTVIIYWIFRGKVKLSKNSY